MSRRIQVAIVQDPGPLTRLLDALRSLATRITSRH